MSTNRKGQFFSYDAIIGAMIFVIAFGLLVTYWWSVRSVLNPERDDMLKEALRVSDGLLTPGNPAFWQTGQMSDVTLIGFTDSYQNETLIPEKLAAFKQYANNPANYQNAREHLLRTSYNFYITVETIQPDGTTAARDCSGSCEMGKPPASNARNQVAVVRIAKYGDSLADLKIVLWA